VKTRELYEVRALAGCYLAERMLERVPASSIYGPDLARVVHKAMFGGVYRFAGQYRQPDELVRIGDSVSTAHPARIERELRLLEFQGKELAQRNDPYRLAAFMHIRFERIHPFMDGNGRVGRALLEAQLATLTGLTGRESIVAGTAVKTYHEAFRASERPTGYTQLVNLLRQRNGLQPERAALPLPFRIAPLLPSAGREPSLAKDLEYSRVGTGRKLAI
jgi:fido (protein-threonine AMPylation protein)